jgi:1-aminocyclopropane-1-carboxylate deaminase
MQWSQFTPGKIQLIQHPAFQKPFHVLRLDQLRSWSSGNKYYKLKYQLQYVLENNIHKIVSKGGMFSNHLVALAEACYAFDIRLISILRAFEPDERNPTIRKLRELNGQVEYAKPDEYLQFDQAISNERFPDAYFIAEGGLSPEGIAGAAEITDEIQNAEFNHIVIAGGSMCTACGLINSLPAESTLHIVPAWKGCERSYIESILSEYDIQPTCQWDIWPDYHFGGFGKFNKDLIEFMTKFTTDTGIILDPVYTGKLLFAINDKMKGHFFGEQDSILAIHTGGLQGLDGYVYRFPEQWGAYVAMAKAL